MIAPSHKLKPSGGRNNSHAMPKLALIVHLHKQHLPTSSPNSQFINLIIITPYLQQNDLTQSMTD